MQWMRPTATVFGFLVVSMQAAETTPPKPLLGYTAEAFATEIKWEDTLRSIPDQSRQKGRAMLSPSAPGGAATGTSTNSRATVVVALIT